MNENIKVLQELISFGFKIDFFYKIDINDKRILLLGKRYDGIINYIFDYFNIIVKPTKTPYNFETIFNDCLIKIILK